MIWKITRRKHNVVFVFGKQEPRARRTGKSGFRRGNFSVDVVTEIYSVPHKTVTGHYL